MATSIYKLRMEQVLEAELGEASWQEERQKLSQQQAALRGWAGPVILPTTVVKI